VTDGHPQNIIISKSWKSKRKEPVMWAKWNADYLIRTKSGDKIWVSDVSYPWFDENRQGYRFGWKLCAISPKACEDRADACSLIFNLFQRMMR
jgi:hypothetical protein